MAATVLLLIRGYLLSDRRQPLPVAGWLGAALILISEALLGLGVKWIGTYFTPLCWSGYILLVDSAVVSLEGSSRLRRSPKMFCLLAAASIPLWLIFEGFNLHLKNWTYVGLPQSIVARDAGYIWAFATIWPAIFETADLLRAFGLFTRQRKPHSPVGRGTLSVLILTGAACVFVPVLLPAGIGSYLFGLVWIGFALLLDPLNYIGGGSSLLREWEQGSTTTLRCFLLSGLICGFIWEFWNYWAHARWVYIFPILQNCKIFEMPAPGFLGFPPFAVECFVMFEFLVTAAACFSDARKRAGRLVSATREV